MKKSEMLALLHVENSQLDCSPIYEAIVAQTYVIDVWVHSDESVIIFHAELMKIQENSDTWIELGVKKGERVEEDVFETAAEAMSWVNAKTTEKFLEVTGDMSNPELYAV
jgi:hypothetical protein